MSNEQTLQRENQSLKQELVLTKANAFDSISKCNAQVDQANAQNQQWQNILLDIATILGLTNPDISQIKAAIEGLVKSKDTTKKAVVKKVGAKK